ncbi:rod-binding protein [Zhengella sp. ZM62]|uniref:rod-binding protein n=1 Tax=Zhengella sedimenti TaxID=3390035 RepID=UPI0039750064
MDGPMSAVAGLSPLTLRPETPQRPQADGVAWQAALSGQAAGTAKAPDAGMAAMQRFEALVLQNFIEAMLPDDASSVYGKGLSGEMWKSMMSEKIAEEFASQGGLGIAERIGAQLARSRT